MEIIAGVDEAGRGPLAGPVVAAAVILPNNHDIVGLRDSKKLTPKRRAFLFDEVMERSVSVGTGIVDVKEIDKINILNATYKAMQMALGKLSRQPDKALIDGYALPSQIIPNEGIIKGDDKVDCIRAASIVAKVTRDRIMLDMDRIFPEYGFAKHKGYGTALHLEALSRWMATPIHRKSYAPVRAKLKPLQWYKKERRIGWLGEKLAALFLFDKGYKILEMNVNIRPYGEIDILAEHSGELIFIEIKTGLSNSTIPPALNLTQRKMEKLESAIQMYMQNNEINQSIRFEIITLQIDGKNHSFNHIKHVDFNFH